MYSDKGDSCGEDLEENLPQQPISSASSDDDMLHIEETPPWVKVRVSISSYATHFTGYVELGNDAMAILDEK